ncbi:hypothetical protein J3R30DRAFT_39782 [Lentinula aciculospora]|uniref:Uncharacterized protein n=1 Tax=Lentinula aciculospora TaxID=153920 RepID=A0A9W9AUY8_9AGAR|nr:hypothetical protein J3R30DRAFT_39782 [Lentinula aciculospora]
MSRFPSSNPINSRAHITAQTPSGQVYHVPPTVPVAQPSTYYYPPQHNSTDLLTHRILDAITPILSAHQAGTLSRLEKSEQCICGALKPLENNLRNMEQSQVSIEKTIFESNSALRQTIVAQTDTLKGILSRLSALEIVVGKHKDGESDETSTIVAKLDAVSHSMGEFLERALDPYAAIGMIWEPVLRQARSLTPSEPAPSSSSA